MNHLAKPLETLAARAAAFVADPDARFLYVSVDQDLAEAAVQIVLGQEWHPENTRPILLLTAPSSSRRPGWSEYTRALREEYARRQDAYDQEAIGLRPLPSVDAGAEPLVAFAVQLGAVLAALRDDELGTDGVVVAIAPESLEGAAEFARELRALMEAPSLVGVRWIWIHGLADPAGADPAIVGTLGEEAWRCPCHVDSERANAEADALLAGMRSALASGVGGFPGGARPRTAPPPHPDDPPAAAAPTNGSPSPHAFLVPFLTAMQCLRNGDRLASLPLLRDARDLSAAARRSPEAAEMELLLAVTAAQICLDQGAGITPAVPIFQAAIQRAETTELPLIAAKGALVLGTFADLAKDAELAAGSFMRSAALAKKAGVPVLEFQALRMAGELGIRAGARQRGGERLKDALQVASAVPPAEAQAAGLSDSALDLVAFCRKNGLEALARHAETALAEEG